MTKDVWIALIELAQVLLMLAGLFMVINHCNKRHR